MVRESPDPGGANTAPHRGDCGGCRRDRLAAARGGCDSTRAPNPGVHECHSGRGTAPSRTVGSSQREVRALPEAADPDPEQTRATGRRAKQTRGPVTGVGVTGPSAPTTAKSGSNPPHPPPRCEQLPLHRSGRALGHGRVCGRQKRPPISRCGAGATVLGTTLCSICVPGEPLLEFDRPSASTVAATAISATSASSRVRNETLIEGGTRGTA